MALVTKTLAQFVTDVESGFVETVWSALKKPGQDRVIAVVRTANGDAEVWDIGV